MPGAASRRGRRAAALEPDQSGIERAEAGGGGRRGAGPHLTAPSGPAPIRPRPAPGALRQSTRAAAMLVKGTGPATLVKWRFLFRFLRSFIPHIFMERLLRAQHPARSRRHAASALVELISIQPTHFSPAVDLAPLWVLGLV